MMFKSLALFVTLLIAGVLVEREVTWDDLSDVTFEEQYVEELEVNFLYPTFGEKVRKLEGQEIALKGFLLVMDREEGYYILSKNPFASCFFCGAAGPETIVELNMKKGEDKLVNDEMITIRGTLRLNSDDIYHCNYIFDDAVPVN
jgi:hypothetical protein